MHKLILLNKLFRVEFNQGLMNKSDNDLTSHRKG